MTWIVREGVAGTPKGTGRHLWAADPYSYDWTLGGKLGTAYGGNWQTVPPALIAWWEQGQCGAVRYSTRDEAWRVAKRVNGRVIKLTPRSTSPRVKP